MPIFEYQGKTYDVADQYIDSFAEEFPDAKTMIDQDGNNYSVKSKYYKDFLNEFSAPRPEIQKAMATTYSVAPEPSEGAEEVNPVDLAKGSGRAKISAPKPQQNEAPSTPIQAEPIRKFGEGVKQGYTGIIAGSKYGIGEAAEKIVGTRNDDYEALKKIAQLEAEGKDVAEEAQKEYAPVENINPLLSGILKITGGGEAIGEVEKNAQANRTIRKVLEETGGDIEKAKLLLGARAGQSTYADKMRDYAAAKMAQARPTKGWATVGALVPQMAGNVVGLGLSAITKMPVFAQVLGNVNTGVLTASSAGQAMAEARQAGASNAQVWGAGLVNGLIEKVTEDYQLNNRYVKRLVDAVKGRASKQLIDAVSEIGSPANKEMQDLLARANKRLGGKLFSGKNVADYLGDVVSEGSSEFTAEALQTIAPILYENKEDYPTLMQALEAGVEGFKGGVLMGGFMGGISKTAEHRMNRDRRKAQGYVKVAEITDNNNNTEVVEVVRDNENPDQEVFYWNGEKIPILDANVRQVQTFSFDDFERGRIELEDDEAYENGRSLESPEEKSDATTALNVATQEFRERFGLGEDGDVDTYLGANPYETARLEYDKDPELGQVALNYIYAKSNVDGIIDSTKDQIEQRISEATSLIDSRINKTDGMIHPAILRENGKSVYIIDGDVKMFDDGSINTQESPESIIIVDAETMKPEFIAPSVLSKADALIDPNVEKESVRSTITEAIATQTENEMNGVQPFNIGDVYPIIDTDGTERTVQVVAKDGNGNVQVLFNGEQEPTQATINDIQQLIDTSRRNRYMIAQEANKAMEDAQIAENIEANDSDVETMPDVTPATVKREVPMQKNGQPDFNAMDAEMFVDEYVNRYGEDSATKLARKNISVAREAIAKIDKKIDDVVDPNQMEALSQQKDAAQAQLDRYIDILGRLGATDNETEAEEKSRLRKDAGNKIAQLFPDGLPNVESFILADIATGNRIRWSDKEVNGAVTSRGLGAELGYTEAERRKRLPLIGKDAMTPEEYAESLRERLDAAGIRYDESSLRDAVLSVYQSVDSRKGAWDALEDISRRGQEPEMDTDWEDMQAQMAYNKAQNEIAPALPDMPDLATIEEETPISGEEEAEIETQARAEEQADYDAMMEENPPVIEENAEDNEEVALTTEKRELQNKIQDWLTPENVSWAEGRELSESIEKFGNTLEPIAILPKILNKYFPNVPLYLYSGKGYLIDHAANHHPELAVEEYNKIQEVIDSYDDIKDLSTPNTKKIAFVKMLDKGFAVVTELAEKDGKIMLHKTFFYKDSQGKRVPYKNKPSLLRKSPVDGSTTISPTEETVAGRHRNISALGVSESKDTTSEPKSQEVDKKILQENVVEKKVNTPTKQTYTKVKKLLIEPTKPDYTTVVAPSMVTMEVPMNVYKYVSKDKLNMYSGVYFDKDKYLVATDLFNLVALKVRDMQRSDADKFVTKQLEKKAEGTFNWRDILVPVDKSIDGVIDFVDIVGKVGKMAKKNEKPKAVRIAYNGESILIPAERLQPLADFQKAVGIGDIRFANIGKDNNIPKIQINTGANVALAVGLDPKVAPYWSVYEYEVGGELTPPTSEKQESAPVEDVTPKSEVPDVIRGDKWNATGEPTKMKFNRKGDNFDGYITVGKKKYGRTTSEGEELEILYEDYGNLENAWNAYERGDVFISPNLASIVKAILVDRYGDVKDTAEVDDGQQILFRNVYHGSGAEFDKFDHSFIGTGEGNQAFGWGTYVTEVEGIGKQYARMTSKPRLSFKGDFVNTEGFYNPWRIVSDLFNDYHGKLRDMRAAAERYSSLVEEDNPKLKTLWEDVKQVLSVVRSGDLKTTPARYLYSVEIPDNDGINYLEYGKPLSKTQLNNIKRALYNHLVASTYKGAEQELKQELDEVFAIEQDGKDIYGTIGSYLGSDKAASEFLNKNGYVGISYPADQGRAGGARNYVIFNEGDLDIMDNVRFRPAKKKAPETASVQEEHQPTVVSSADGAKILKNIDSTIKEYENKGSHSKTLLGDIAKAIGAKKKGSDSQYATFEAKNGKIFTIRLADHNAHTSTFDNHNEKEGISIVVSAKANNKIDNDGVAHIVEYFYDAIKLRKADGKPLVEILKSIKQSLYSGEYKDTTGIAVRDEVNMQEEVFFRTADSNFTPPFYSNAEYAVKGVKQEKATPEQWLKMIEKNGGLKAGEDKWLGLSDWLKASDKKTLTKQEVLDFIKENQIQIEEVEYAENPQGFEELKKEYDGWLRDGGYDYAWDKLIERYGYDSTVAFDDVGGELVVQYGNTASKLLGGEVSTINNTRLSYTTDGLENKREIALTVPTIESWNESDDIHFGDAGQGRAIAWVRFGETTDSEGKRVLVIDEVQSKRHQEGREKGYRPSNIEQYLKDNGVEVIETGEFYEFHKNGELDKRFSKGLLHNDIKRAKELYVGGYVKSDIPSAPFEKNWAELAMKRMLRYAAENGFDKIAWTTGEQQAERYDISKSVDNIKSEDNNVEETSDGTLIVKNITIYAGDSVHNLFVDANGVVRGREYDGKKLSDIVGKPLAEKLMEKGDFELEGDGLRIGGEGMKAFYDQMLPSFMNKYGKKWGVKVQDVTLPHLAKPSSVMHSIDVTDAMRESVMQGQPMFRIIDDYKEKFSDLQSEYDALDKNDTEALNEWIDKKLNVIKSYLDYVIQDFNYPVKEYFIVANKQDMRTLFDRCVDASIIEDEVTFDEFEKEINRAEATYVEDLDIIVATVYGLPNNENSIFSTLFHEQTHKVINSVATKQQLSDIWNEAVKNNEPKVSRIIELYGEDPVRNGAEYVAYTIERFSSPKRRENLESYIKDDGTVTLDYFTKNAKKTLPLRNALLENILKFYNDEYRNRKEENTDGELLGRRDKGVGSIEATQSRTGHGQQGADRRGRVLKSATSLASSLGVKLNIIEDVTEIVDSNKEFQRKKRGAKAWYDVATDQVYFVVPNATSIADAQQSVLHEVVAHKGLRDVIGRENFDKFLDKVFHNAAPEIRAQIVRLASQNGWNSRVATEEYLASLAEKGFDGRENRTFWQKVRDFFMDMLRDAKIAIGYNINDNDMRYMLWRTYQMQKSKGAMAVAENVAMQQKLGVGNFRTRFIGEKGASNLDKTEEATTRLDNLAIAREMEDAGKDAKTIKMATGWERGSDNKWRYEVKDIELKNSPDRIINGLRDGKEYRLEQVLTDDSMMRLTAEYPEFMNIKLSYDNNKQDTAGYWSGSDLRIVLTPAAKLYNLQEIIIHEIQHAIQDAEGFARGITPQYFIRKDLSAYKGDMEDVVNYGDADVAYELYSIRENAERLVSEGKYKYLRNAIKSIVKTYSTNGWLSLRMYNFIDEDSNTTTKDVVNYIANVVTDGSLEQWRELPYDMRNSKADAMDKYMRTSGEVEARNVETRMGMSADERRASLASETEDVAREDQIFIENSLHSGSTRQMTEEDVVFNPNQIKSATDNVGAFDSNNDDIRFRTAPKSADIEDGEVKQIRKKYDKKVNTGRKGTLKATKYNFIEAFQDEMRSLKEYQKLVKEAYGIDKLPSHLDVYALENRIGSAGFEKFRQFEDGIYEDMMRFIDDYISEGGETLESVITYARTKSGLERNREFTVRDYIDTLAKATLISKQEAKQRLEQVNEDLKNDLITPTEADARRHQINNLLNAKKHSEEEIKAMREQYKAQRDAYRNLLENGMVSFEEFNKMSDAYAKKFTGQDIADYSGLSATAEKMGKDPDEWSNVAMDIVKSFEQKHDNTIAFWGSINACNNAVLREVYNSGMLNGHLYDYLQQQFLWYIPMSGFNEDTAEDVYSYIGGETGAFTPPVKRAGGRESEGDDPFAIIGNKMQGAILQGNRNRLKLSFMNLTRTYPTDLVTEGKVWLVKQPDGTWVMNSLEIPEGTSSEEAARLIEEYDKEMRDLKKQGMAMEHKNKLNLPYAIKVKSHKNDHEIIAYRNGQPYVMYVNGNPQLAKAINGKLKDKNINLFYKKLDEINRLMSANKTSWNPDFIPANVMRDFQQAILMTFIDAGVKDAAKVAALYVKVFPEVVRSISGSSNKDGKYSAYFEEFLQNGGETGYSHLRDVDEWKKVNQRRWARLNNAEKIGASGVEAFNKVGAAFSYVNRIAEDSTRFTIYVYNRQKGKTIAESIKAAKDISTNFNKKGSGATEGVWGFVANFLRRWFLFFNPMVQGVYQHWGKMNNSKKRYALVFASMAGLGYLMAVLNHGWSDDDDEEMKYFNQNDYTRRNNLMIYTGNGYVKIPLAPIFREMYALGDIMYSVQRGVITPMEGTMEVVNLVRGIFKLEGQSSLKDNDYSWLRLVLPESSEVIADVEDNVTFTGAPLYKDTPWNKNDPEYQKVYKGTWQPLIELSKAVNGMLPQDEQLSEVDDQMAGKGSNKWINPAVWQHIIEEVLGGVGKTAGDVYTIGESLINDKDLNMYNIPVAKRFYSKPDERVRGRILKNRYFDAMKSLDRMDNKLKKAQHFYDDSGMSLMEKAENIAEYWDSEVGKRHKLLKDSDSRMNKLTRREKVAKNDAEREQIALLKEQEMTNLIQALKSLESSNK